MGTQKWAFALALSLICGAAFAEAEFDFEELMNDVETKIQNVQNNIAAKDAATAATQAKELQEQFKLVEGFFQKRGDAPDAVHNSQEYQARRNRSKALCCRRPGCRGSGCERLFQTMSRRLPR
ncbi:hypothetical protein [Methylomonas koyamae]|uniref:hypothetical protein n=1 Tax=Methylomonas koyamae TaxID=702114 RepID=UPI0006CFE99B|nr:hypothetical protein [Methylomonas koyamae]